MRRYVALLRGVNVGGKTTIRMADLRDVLASLDLRDAQTLLQSGNAVFSCPAKPRATLEAALEDAIERRFGRRFDCHVRSAEQWDAIVAANPFPREAEADPAHLLVAVARQQPDPKLIATIETTNPGPERLRVVGEALYIHFPDGIGRSKLMNHPGWRNHAPSGTARNWNTVQRIASLLGQV